MKRAVLALALSVILSACGKSSPTAPTSNSPTRIIGLGGNLSLGAVRMGTSLDATFRITNSGNAMLTVSGLTLPAGYSPNWTHGTIPAGGAQDVTIRFSPTAEQTYAGTLTVTADQTSGANTISISGTGTRAPAALTTFGAGQYLVGTEIVPGRYYNHAANGCYWARLSGTDDAQDEIIANQLIEFDADQWIVDILSSDKAFKTLPGCGTWFNSPRKGSQAAIAPGMWLVGDQVRAGTYRATAQTSCHWERVRDFTNNMDAVIESKFTSAPGTEVVTIAASDAGFDTNEECGTWTRDATAQAPSPPQSSAEIQRNRALSRQHIR